MSAPRERVAGAGGINLLHRDTGDLGNCAAAVQARTVPPEGLAHHDAAPGQGGGVEAKRLQLSFAGKEEARCPQQELEPGRRRRGASGTDP